MERDPFSKPSFRFPSAFRLKRNRFIRPLFDRSRDDVETIASGCVRIVYRVVPKKESGVSVPLQVGFAMGRRVKKAVDRNRIKRYLREAFRLNQHTLIDVLPTESDTMLTLMVIFRGDPDKARYQVPRHLPTALAIMASRIRGGDSQEDKIQEGSAPPMNLSS